MSVASYRCICACLGAGVFLASQSAALAQKTQDPNLGHFYMARQQITITDDSAVVNDKRTQPTPAGKPAPGNGALPSGALPLPKAQWQQLAPTETAPSNLNTSLPKVENGVPPKPGNAAGAKAKGLNAAGAAGKGNAAQKGNLAGKSASARKGNFNGKGKSPSSAAATPTAPKVSTYSPYKKYSLDNSGQGATAAGNATSKTKVRADLLHWARPKSRSN